MPIYQYKCSECDHQLEALQKMSDPRLTECPACEQSALVKQLTAAAFKLNGTGWYETDFKNSGAKKAKPSATESKESSKTDSNATASASADTGADKPANSAEKSSEPPAKTSSSDTAADKPKASVAAG